MRPPSPRVAHAWSSHLGLGWSARYDRDLLRRGFEPWHFTPPATTSPGDHWRPLHFTRSMRPSAADLRSAIAFRRELRALDVSIVHTHNAKVGAVGRVVARSAGVPVVVHTVHGLVFGWEDGRVGRTIQTIAEGVAGGCCDAVLFQSKEDATLLTRTGALPESKVVHVGNGIDLRRFEPARFSPVERAAKRRELGVSDDEVLFLTAGRLVRGKGISELMSAAAGLAGTRPGVRLAIAGRHDPDSPEAVTMAEVEQAADAGVLVLGQRDDMDALYAACDVVVLATWREGFPRALMEGAAMGKPLLATNVRGCREVVRHGTNGLLVRPRAPDALAEGMRRLAVDPDLRRRLAGAAREIAVRSYDIDDVIRQTHDLYEQLLERAGRRRPRTPTEAKQTMANGVGATR